MVSVLVLAWNRPYELSRVLRNLSKLGLTNIYISVDGPRKDVESDYELIKQVHTVITDHGSLNATVISHNDNHGCRHGVSRAVSWFFEKVTKGIIIEDDILVNSSFLLFASKMLDCYEANPDIGCITANNFQPIWRTYASDFYFSCYPHCWGWATWRDKWSMYDNTMKCWSKLKDSDWLHSMGGPSFAEFWSKQFDLCYNQQKDSWATVWTYSLWHNRQLTCTPRAELSSNIGLGYSSRGSSGTTSTVQVQKRQQSIDIIRFPDSVTRDLRNDRYVQATNYTSCFLRKCSRKILRTRLFL
jgi:hypothetical protein